MEAESKIKEAGLVPAFTIDDRGNLFCSVRVGAGARIGLDVDAPDETAAMEKAAEEFKVPATRLMTIRRS